MKDDDKEDSAKKGVKNAEPSYQREEPEPLL